MKIMIRCDMEGITGVVNERQAEPGAEEFGFGKRMFMSDLNALIEGIFSTGDHEVWIYDMHYYGTNVVLDEIPEQVKVICGKPDYRPGNAGGLDKSFDSMILLGLHSMAGSGQLLAHNYEHEVEEIRLNGLRVGEIGLEAAIAGEFNVPLGLVIADSAGCQEAKKLNHEILTVTVKESLGSNSAICYSAPKTRKLIAKGARDLVSTIDGISPFKITSPVELKIKMAESNLRNRVFHTLGQDVDNEWVIIKDILVTSAWLGYLRAKKV